MKVVLAGGSGSLGTRLAVSLSAAGHEPVVLTRRVRPGLAARQVLWDGRTQGDWVEELDGAVVVNLAGELVDRRPSAAGIELLTRSRVEPTLALVEASRSVGTPPPAWLQLSTLAIYGDSGDAELDERAPVGAGPPQMTAVATAWEAAVAGARADRVLVLRTGVVLDADGPALRRLTGLARWGLGGRIASGRQWISWLHVADFTAAVEHLVERSALDGVVHVTSPQPVRNAELMAGLRRVVGRPPAPPTPAFAVRVGALALRTDPALALTGRRCVPTRLVEDGFGFAHPGLAEALDDLTPHG